MIGKCLYDGKDNQNDDDDGHNDDDDDDVKKHISSCINFKTILSLKYRSLTFRNLLIKASVVSYCV